MQGVRIKHAFSFNIPYSGVDVLLWYSKYLHRLFSTPDQFITIRLPVFLACEQIDLDEPTAASVGPSSPPRDAAGSASSSISSKMHVLTAAVPSFVATVTRLHEFGCANALPANSDNVVTIADIGCGGVSLSALTDEAFDETDGTAGEPTPLVATVELPNVKNARGSK